MGSKAIGNSENGGVHSARKPRNTKVAALNFKQLRSLIKEEQALAPSTTQPSMQEDKSDYQCQGLGGQRGLQHHNTQARESSRSLTKQEIRLSEKLKVRAVSCSVGVEVIDDHLYTETE